MAWCFAAFVERIGRCGTKQRVRPASGLGGITRRTYDGNNNMLSEMDPLGNTTNFTYDALGNLLTQTDPLGNVTRNTYLTISPGLFASIRGARPVSYLATTTDPLGGTTANSYDGSGNLLSSTDAAGNITRYAYDSTGNQSSITDAAGNITRFAYDSRGNLIQQIDALGNVTAFTYHGNGNQLTQSITVTGPFGPRLLTTSTAYDPNGHRRRRQYHRHRIRCSGPPDRDHRRFGPSHGIRLRSARPA